MNIFRNILIVTTMLFLCACGETKLNYISSQPTVIQASFMIEKEKTLPPYGYVDFCLRESKECPEWKTREQNKTDVSFTASLETSSIQTTLGQARAKNIPIIKNNLSFSEIMAKLEEVNNVVNIAIRPVSDPNGFGQTENWRIPDISGYFGDIGDCEDYALLKRKMLAQSGFDYNKLSMAVVRQSDGSAHAILVVRTNYGDYVLDNLETDVKPWQEVSYKWVKKQSIINPSVWVSI